MEQNEIKVADILCIIRSTCILQKSADYVRKQRAKPSSIRCYCSLLCRYDVRLACDLCIRINEGTHKCRIDKSEHKCSQNRLVLFAKNTTDDGDLLRKRPAGYNPLTTDHICEHLDLNEPCLEKHLCPYPHTDVERDLWKEDYNDTISIASLVSDLRESSLLFSVAIEYLSKKFNGTFKLVCATCYQESYEVITKRHHVPECRLSGHYWNKKKLVFESSLDFDDVNGHDDEAQELISCVRSLMDIVPDYIAGEAARLRQGDRSKMLCAARNAMDEEGEHDPYYSESDDSDNNENYHLAKTDKEIFDEDAIDVLNNAAFDDDTGDRKDKNVTISRVKRDYYKILSEEETQDDSEVIYRCGKITLHGAFAGSCVIDGGELNGCEVELRGRANCGPAFDGDTVRVKMYEKDKNKDFKTDNSKADNSKSGNSSQFYGTVVNVVKRDVHRTARTFVCTVGRHEGHLMTPLCGTAPKFSIVDTCLMKRYGQRKKHNYVAVYNDDLKLIKTVKLDPSKRKEMLFVVKYLKWENAYKYPLGYVCCIQHESHTVKESQKMLNLRYELSCNEDTEPEITVKEKNEFEEQLEDAELVGREGREDMRRLLTVSIDPPGTKCIDDAVSLKKSDDKFVVWTHVTDVTHYIQKGDICDDSARKYMLSFPRQSVHMLPKKLAKYKCSLLENKCRRTMSFRFELTTNGEVLSSTEPLPSLIRNDKQLSYEDVQEIIDGPLDFDDYDKEDIDADIEEMLIHLHKLATVLRRRRMRDGSHYYEYSREHCFNRQGIDNPFDADQNHDAQRIVEEFMILTNQRVGDILRQKYPDCTPFLVQNEPNSTLLENWKKNHGYIVPFSFYLNQFRQHLSAGGNSAVTQLLMLRNCWDAISAAVKECDLRKVRTIMGSELLHPLHNIALKSWFNIQELSHYSCYVNDGEHSTRHFSLQTCDYVHFTSPLRRYMDIIAHRLVKADPYQPPYMHDEVMELCEKMNMHKSRQRSYDRSCELLKMASMLQQPFYIPCYVENFNNFSICLSSCYFQTDSPLACRLKFSEMTLHDNPEISDNSGRKVTLSWSKRYYDTRKSRTTNARSDSATDYLLDSGMFGMTVSYHVWRSMHKAVKGQTEKLLAGVSRAMRANLPMPQQQQEDEEEQRHKIVQEVTSEMAENKPLVRHHVKFSCDIARSMVVSVQFGAKAVDGILQPVIKLVNLTHEQDICIEHQRDPVHAFALVATKKVKSAYNNIEEYQNIWKAILAMEAATNAVRSKSIIVCSHVPVSFVKRNGKIYGKLKLPKEFCDTRYISLYTVSKQEACGSRVSEEETHDYMCIRYFLKKSRLAKSFIRNVWVAHAAVVFCSCTKDVIELTVKCNCSESEAPSELFNCTRNSPTVDCTVEFLQRALPDK